jgi:hypothetical protein
MQVSPLQDFPKFCQRITYMLPMVLQIFLPCYFGNEVYLASENLSASIFHSNWLHGSKKYRNALKLFITNAKKPIVIVSAKIFGVTLDSFVSICQITYKFYALLQSLNYWTFIRIEFQFVRISISCLNRCEQTAKKCENPLMFTLSLLCQSKNLHNMNNCFTLRFFCVFFFLLLLEKSQSRAHCINQQRSGMTWKPRTHFFICKKEKNTQFNVNICTIASSEIFLICEWFCLS